ncbi:MAG: 3-oxoacyl-[acyl-carrier-protein] reductase [Chlamydiia bacterium]|nr:3-oxoacyl-[acyl-carrier-protein] reductase [Chlamydiia bacterium]
MFDLSERTAIVTGGNAGIGRAIALKFAKQGANVAIFGNDIQRGAQVVEEIHQLVGKEVAMFYQVNVADQKEVDEAVKKVLDHFGNVDILVNNAGVTRDMLLMRMTEKDWDDVMEINVKSCYNTTHALVRHMMKARKGVIINMSSVVGISGNEGQANYAASKAAIIGYTKSIARELAPRNIRANCVAPGFIQTRMTDKLTQEQKEATLKNVPLGRMGEPDDIANAVLFLVSDEGGYITGQTLTVDGGMVMN